MNDIMLDLETMGTDANAAIIAIGAVGFDINTRAIGDTFYVTVTLESSVKHGGVIDPSTVLWWMEQGDEARSGFSSATTSIEHALSQFSSWAGTQSSVSSLRVWGNGAGFDNVVLGSAYKRLGMSAPWKFWNDRCYRTIKAQYPNVKLARMGTHHNALDDAISQAKHLINMLNPTPV